MSRSDLAKVASAASIGSLVEWYDFFIAGSAAATVWPAIFFPKSSASAALALSFSTFAVTYLARPIAAFTFGHFGDRAGRRTTLVWTLLTMAVAMFGIALTPAYASIGIVAPILIALFRFVQGFGIGGEWQGGVVWVAEFTAGRKTRGFWTSVVQLANSLGLSIGTLAFYIASIYAPGPAFEQWGWRVPFAVGGAVVIAGAIIRYRMAESPLFHRLQASGAMEKHPAVTVLRDNWKNIILLSFVISFVVVVENLNLNPVGLSYLAAKGLKPPANLFIVGAAAAFSAIPLLLGAIWSDQTSRRRPMLVGIILTLFMVYPFYLLVNTGSFAYAALGAVALLAFPYIAYGVFPIAFSEFFPTKYRYSGVGLAFQIGAIYTGLILVAVVPYILGVAHGLLNAWPYLAGLSMLMTVVALICLLVARRPKETDLETI